jgi:hypothetical protein
MFYLNNLVLISVANIFIITKSLLLARQGYVNMFPMIPYVFLPCRPTGWFSFFYIFKGVTGSRNVLVTYICGDHKLV